AYGGHDVGPGPLPLPVTRTKTLAEIARDTFVDACAGESLAALEVRERARIAKDPVVRDLMNRIADDEDRHAELAWKTIAWAVRVGGEDVRAALAAERDRLAAENTSPGAMREIVLPCV